MCMTHTQMHIAYTVGIGLLLKINILKLFIIRKMRDTNSIIDRQLSEEQTVDFSRCNDILFTKYFRVSKS